MGATETERGKLEKKKEEREKYPRDNQGGGERKRVICSNSTFLPLILLHNRTVKSMWSLATSSCLALSLLLSIYLSLFFFPPPLFHFTPFAPSLVRSLQSFRFISCCCCHGFLSNFLPPSSSFCSVRVPQSDQRKLSSKVFSLPFIAFCYFTFNLPLPAYFLYLCLISSSC